MSSEMARKRRIHKVALIIIGAGPLLGVAACGAAIVAEAVEEPLIHVAGPPVFWALHRALLGAPMLGCLMLAVTGPGVRLRLWATIPIVMTASGIVYELYAGQLFSNEYRLMALGPYAFLGEFVCVLAWFLAIGVAAVAFAGPRHPLAGTCTCGYDLTGNTSGVCPECGTRIVHEASSVTSACSCSDIQEQTERTEKT